MHMKEQLETKSAEKLTKQKTLKQPNGKNKEIMEFIELEVKTDNDREAESFSQSQSVKEFTIDFDRDDDKQ